MKLSHEIMYSAMPYKSNKYRGNMPDSPIVQTKSSKASRGLQETPQSHKEIDGFDNEKNCD